MREKAGGEPFSEAKVRRRPPFQAAAGTPIACRQLMLIENPGWGNYSGHKGRGVLLLQVKSCWKIDGGWSIERR